MLCFKCVCGCSQFEVNAKTDMCKCVCCGQRFVFEDKWVKFDLVKNVVSDVVTRPDRVFERACDVVVESVGEFRKRLGIKKVKKKLGEGCFPSVEERELLCEYESGLRLERLQLLKRWDCYLSVFERDGVVSFDKKEHFGKLRGCHIAKFFCRDLKRLGFRARLVFRGDCALVVDLEKKRT